MGTRYPLRVSDQFGDAVELGEAPEIGGEIVVADRPPAAGRLAPPFEQQGERGRIHLRDRGQVERDLRRREQLVAPGEQLDRVLQIDRPLHGAAAAVAGDHLADACFWAASCRFLSASALTSPSMPPFRTSLSKLPR